MNDAVVMGEKNLVYELWDSGTSLFATFISSTETANSQTNAHVANTIDGGRLELLKCGQSATAMGSAALEVSPYSTRMRPVVDVSNFSAFDVLYLVKAVFKVYDVTLTGDPNQDAQILTDIENSLSSVNDGYVQSRFRFAEFGSWQPNFFRPTLRLQGGPDIFGNASTSNFAPKSNKGDISIGFPMPYDFNPPTPRNMGVKPQNREDALELYAGCGQLVMDTATSTLKIQRYPVYAHLEFLGVKK